jgi:hypothetical protein
MNMVRLDSSLGDGGSVRHADKKKEERRLRDMLLIANHVHVSARRNVDLQGLAFSPLTW